MHLYRQTNASRACPEPSRKHAYKHAVLDIRARDNDVLTRCTILDHEKTKLGRQPGTNRSLHEPKTTKLRRCARCSDKPIIYDRETPEVISASGLYKHDRCRTGN